MRAVHFGAGNIGRGFIGLLLRDAGYDVCFVDVNQEIIDEINRRGEYVVAIADQSREEIVVTGVKGVNSLDEAAVISAIAEADLVTTAVGPNILARIAPTIRKAIMERLTHSQKPLNVIACENMVGGSTILKGYVMETLTEAEQLQVGQFVGFPDSAVDRIVPNQQHEDKLRVEVEPFFEWIIDQKAFVGSVPTIDKAHFVDDLTPFIERKLFTVNTGHAIAAYLGYHFGVPMIADSITDERIRRMTMEALEESGAVLVKKYGFDPEAHRAYIHKILGRFENPYLADEVTRIARGPIRKLGAKDRLVSPATQAIGYGIEPKGLANGMAAALLFNYEGDPEAVELQGSIQEIGLGATITKYCGIEEGSEIHQLVMEKVEELRGLV
ncbi:mannitol-1-phosphate 5-dehydrogenase [Paenibacillus sp. N1-5-1-14]|uniref:mannitol-1-phosphate 5-dehydrogenase n=1 Tax=Paenibacillus radicibacter TaxID=2972488 RepID=UPI0021599F60|nr:mannitol-1-phosphate 5-dehydrogenase [Paenibacillus radicibacter]MCR8642792.1 mannitol-1-phosphate 5-dehydrogenase [Paenibacillus radicibacter]